MKVKDKKVGDIQYIKYRINLPKHMVEDGKFIEKELTIKLEKGKIIIEKVQD